MKKRIISLIITSIMIITAFATLIGCGGEDSGSVSKGPYTISFTGDYIVNENNITVADSEETFTLPTPSNHIEGADTYKFLYWTFNGEKFDESSKVTSDVQLVAVWGRVVKYYVKHYKKNFYSENYSVFATDTKYGAIGENTKITAKSLSGYALNKKIEQVAIFQENQEISLYYNPSKEVVISTSNSKIKEFIACSGNDIYNYVNDITLSKVYDYQDKTEFSWEDKGVGKTYEVKLSTESNYAEESTYTFTTDKTSIVFGFLVPNTTYFIKIICDSEIVDQGSFTTADEIVRYVNISNVPNVRDLGGWKIGDNKRVKYSMLYRGAQFGGIKQSVSSNITEEGKNIVKNILKVKTELDLRTDSGEISNATVNSENLANLDNYYHYSILDYSYCIPETATDKIGGNETYNYYYSKTQSSLSSIFTLLANESNYPVYFHCVGGADRTGTLAFIINGLLGVGFEDLVKDYSLTSFSAYGIRKCYIPEESWNELTLSDVKSSVYNGMYQFYWQIMTYYGTEDGTLSSAIENYLVSGMNIPKAKIDAVKNILIEEI